MPYFAFYPFALYSPKFIFLITFSIRQSFAPFTLISASIIPNHLPFSISHILNEVSFVNIPISPSKSSITLFVVIFKISLINISKLVNPNPLSFSHTLVKISFIISTISPNILSITVGLSMKIISFVSVTIRKSLNSMSMFFESAELTFIRKYIP